MTSSILFAGSEDVSFTVAGQGQIGLGGQTLATFGTAIANNNTWQYWTSSSGYRSAYSRYALIWYSSGQTGNLTWLRTLQFSNGTANTTASTFWTSARMYASANSAATSTNQFIRWVDSAGVVRLRVTQNGVLWPSTIKLEKVSAAGVVTTLATSVSSFGSNGPAIPDKIDVYINYAVSGQFSVYCNGVLIVTYSGDVTTDSQTALAFADFGTLGLSNGGNIIVSSWSEVIVATRDTRNMSLVTLAPTLNGNTDGFTTSGTNTQVMYSLVPNTSSARSANEISYIKIVPPQNGSIATAQIGLSVVAAGTTQMAIYSDSVNTPGGAVASQPLTLLGSSATVVNPSAGYVTYTWSSAVPIQANQVYWLAWRSTGTATWLYNNGGFSTNQYFNQTNGSFPSSASPSGGNTSVNIQYTYTINSPSVGVPYTDTTNNDASATAAQVQEYQITPSLPSGNFSVVALVQHIQATVGTSGPTKVDAVVRTGGSDFVSIVDLVPSTGWSTLPYHWDTNPNTTNAWATAEIVSTSTSFNMGYKSVT